MIFVKLLLSKLLISYDLLSHKHVIILTLSYDLLKPDCSYGRNGLQNICEQMSPKRPLMDGMMTDNTSTHS